MEWLLSVLLLFVTFSDLLLLPFPALLLDGTDVGLLVTKMEGCRVGSVVDGGIVGFCWGEPDGNRVGSFVRGDMVGDTTLHVSSGFVGGATAVVTVSGAAEQKLGEADVSAPL